MPCTERERASVCEKLYHRFLMQNDAFASHFCVIARNFGVLLRFAQVSGNPNTGQGFATLVRVQGRTALATPRKRFAQRAKIGLK